MLGLRSFLLKLICNNFRKPNVRRVVGFSKNGISRSVDFILAGIIFINFNKITMEELLKRITFNPNQCSGKPCIRGMRIRVVDVLQLLANGLTFDQILEELPDLEKDDVKASVLFALKRIDHIVLAA